MSKRRIRLGSGLDPNKLAGTIRQIAVAEPPLPALVCHLRKEEDSWIHLMAVAPTQAEVDALPAITGWKLMLGYPAHEPPADRLSRLSIALPTGAGIDAWQPGIYASILLSPNTSPEAIASLITSLAHSLQNVDAAHEIETALEYP